MQKDDSFGEEEVKQIRSSNVSRSKIHPSSIMNDHNLKITEAKASVTDIISHDNMKTDDLNDSKGPSPIMKVGFDLYNKDAPVVITKIDFDNDHLYPNGELQTINSKEESFTKVKSKKAK